MNGVRRWLWLLPLGALAACATVSTNMPGPVLSGRIAVSVEAENGRPAQQVSASFDLRGDAERGELQLSGPLGTSLAAARWAPGQAEWVTADGTQVFPDLESLATHAFGQPLPLQALPHWLRGKPHPGSAHADLTELRGFEQWGWVIDLSRFADGFLQARRASPPVVSVRVRLDTGL